MNNKFESTYFRFKGAQGRCHEWSDTNSHEFFVSVDGPFKNEKSSYKDSTTFLKAYDSVPEEERCFFEQIREDKAGKEYYDIDWDLVSSADDCEIKRLEQQVFAAFLRVRNQHAPEFALDDEHCRVLSSSNDKKVSLHIVIPTYVFENNHQHLKAFILAFQKFWCSALCDDEDAALLKRIDDGVNSRNRNMRILGSHKFLDPSRPLQRAEWHEPPMLAEDEEFLITVIGSDSIKITSDLQEVVVERAPSTVARKTREAIQSSLPKHILDAVGAKFEQTPHATQFFEMQCYADRPMDFELLRKVQGHCVVCEREHGRENAYLRLAESGAIYLKYYRSSSPGKEVCKCGFALAVEIEAAMALQTPRGLTYADILDDARFLTQDHLAPPPGHLQLGQGNLEIHRQQPPSLLIRGDTGGGKTVFTGALVKANKKSRFVAITCRRSLADMLDARLCFENYQDISDIIACDRVVVQAESLYKLNLKFYCEDTNLILDEVSSLIKQMCSDKTHGDMHNLNLQVFKRLIQRATRVIALDADLCDEEVEIMKSLRSDFKVWNNTFQQQKDDNVVLFDSKMKLIKEVLDLLRLGKRLWISSTMSAGRTEALHAVLTKAGYKGKCVTKNVDEAFKRDVSKNINNVMADLDYFIHTPTISVGVDYNVKGHVDQVIGIFSTHSGVDVESSMQMMRHVRHVNDMTYLVYVDAAIKDLPATVPEVKDWICNQLDIVTGKVRWNSTLKLQFDDANNLTIPDDLYHRMYCHVMAKKHLSMNNFRSRLIRRMTQAGCIVTGRGDKLPRGYPIPKELKEKEKEIAAAWHQQIASAGAISPDEFKRLSRGTRELDSDQRASVHRFALMRAYNVQEYGMITEVWVRTYDKPHEKECYRNLMALSPSCGPSLRSCLEVMQQREDLDLDDSLKGPTTADAHSRLERSRFVKLGYVVDILLACGFEDTFATKEVPAENLKNRIDGI
ncbi:MAG: origin of replication binding protein-domain-containing protein [Linnemannia elongata]|nr:MAG: origin of replication binding protein-domain-containing protein [Linnemannia elongata]